MNDREAEELPICFGLYDVEEMQCLVMCGHRRACKEEQEQRDAEAMKMVRPGSLY